MVNLDNVPCALDKNVTSAIGQSVLQMPVTSSCFVVLLVSHFLVGLQSSFLSIIENEVLKSSNALIFLSL